MAFPTDRKQREPSADSRNVTLFPVQTLTPPPFNRNFARYFVPKVLAVPAKGHAGKPRINLGDFRGFQLYKLVAGLF